MKAARPEKKIIIPKTIQNPMTSPSHGTWTFIPNIPEIIVGIEMTIVIEARNFMTKLTLFEMTEPNVSIVELMMSL